MEGGVKHSHHRDCYSQTCPRRPNARHAGWVMQRSQFAQLLEVSDNGFIDGNGFSVFVSPMNDAVAHGPECLPVQVFESPSHRRFMVAHGLLLIEDLTRFVEFQVCGLADMFYLSMRDGLHRESLDRLNDLEFEGRTSAIENEDMHPDQLSQDDVRRMNYKPGARKDALLFSRKGDGQGTEQCVSGSSS